MPFTSVRGFLSIQGVALSLCFSCTCCQVLQLEESTSSKLWKSLGLSGLPLLRNYFQYILGLDTSSKLYVSVLPFGCVLLPYLIMSFIIGISLQDEVGVRSLPNQCSYTG